MSDKPYRILAIDPGTRESGVVEVVPQENGLWTPIGKLLDNDSLLLMLRRESMWFKAVCFEEIAAMGMAVGKEVFTTVKWVGRFSEAVERTSPCANIVYITRNAVKLHLCGNSRAKDGNVRQAIIDRYGGDSVAIGNKKCPVCKGRGSTRKVPCEACGESGWKYRPGPLVGIASHAWSALAVAVTYIEMPATGGGLGLTVAGGAPCAVQ